MRRWSFLGVDPYAEGERAAHSRLSAVPLGRSPRVDEAWVWSRAPLIMVLHVQAAVEMLEPCALGRGAQLRHYRRGPARSTSAVVLGDTEKLTDSPQPADGKGQSRTCWRTSPTPCGLVPTISRDKSYIPFALYVRIATWLIVELRFGSQMVPGGLIARLVADASIPIVGTYCAIEHLQAATHRGRNWKRRSHKQHSRGPTLFQAQSLELSAYIVDVREGAASVNYKKTPCRSELRSPASFV